MKKKALIYLIVLILSIPSYATNYHIGPSQTYNSISSFTEWTSLIAGDTVFIHYQDEPYREQLLLCQSGEESNPIVIEGVPDINGNLPVISGDNAVIPTQFDGHLPSTIYQGYGIIYVHRSLSDDNYAVEPEWIEIRNLEVQSATPELYTFTNTKGESGKAYPDGSSGIYIKTGNNILVENCIIHDCGNGFYIQGIDAMAHNITVRRCYIYGNGRTDTRKDKEHNVYTEASGITFEYNVIGRLREGSGGIAIKDRSANTVIRYNIIYSGARSLDLVEPENQSTHDCTTNVASGDGMHEEPGFDSTWVYGNVIINGPSSLLSSRNMVHYGADNCPNTSRSGTLFFYNNTVYTNLDLKDHYNSRIFDVTSPRETVELRNNVFYNSGSSNIFFAYSKHGGNTGTFNWEGGNWITSGYTDFYTDNVGVWNENIAPIEGDNIGVLSNPQIEDFSIPVGSPLISSGSGLPETITLKHPVDKEYFADYSYRERSSTNDIGAFQFSTNAPTETLEIFDNFPWLLDIVDPTNCAEEEIIVYQSSNYNFLYIGDETNGILYFQDGTFYCQSQTGFDCVSAYNLTQVNNRWECGEAGPIDADNDGVLSDIDPDDTDPCLPNNTNEACDDNTTQNTIFQDYPWLVDIVDSQNCIEDTIWVYNTGNYSFLYIASIQQLYFENGTFYCQSQTGFDCVSAYNLGTDILEGIWVCQNNSFVAHTINLVNQAPNNIALQKEDSTPLIANMPPSDMTFEVYPNPSQGNLFLSIYQIGTQESQLDIFDTSGRIVFQQKVTSSEAKILLPIDLSSYPKGFYLVRIKNGTHLKTKKLFIQ